MKKIISLILALAIACFAFASCTPAETTAYSVQTHDPNLPAEDGYGLNGETATSADVFKTKVLANGTVSITGVYPSGSELAKIVIPALIDGKKVSTIGESAFATLTSLEEVVIPGYVTKLDAYAFRDCTKLATVKLPEYVSELAEGVFSGCTALTNTDFLNKNLQTLGPRVFEKSGLKSANLPDGISKIGAYAFMSCGTLAEVKLPASLTAIPERMFQSCLKLAKTTGNEGIVIPASIKSIGDYAFFECQQFESITLPAGLEKIGKNAFDTCRRVKNIVIPETVTVIGDKAFNTCQKLESITLPAGEVKIGKALFDGAKNVKIHVKAGSAAEKWCTENGLSGKVVVD